VEIEQDLMEREAGQAGARDTAAVPALLDISQMARDLTGVPAGEQGEAQAREEVSLEAVAAGDGETPTSQQA